MRYLLSYQNTEIILWAAQVFFTNDIFIEIGVCFVQLSFFPKRQCLNQPNAVWIIVCAFLKSFLYLKNKQTKKTPNPNHISVCFPLCLAHNIVCKISPATPMIQLYTAHNPITVSCSTYTVLSHSHWLSSQQWGIPLSLVTGGLTPYHRHLEKQFAAQMLKEWRRNDGRDEKTGHKWKLRSSDEQQEKHFLFYQEPLILMFWSSNGNRGNIKGVSI